MLDATPVSGITILGNAELPLKFLNVSGGIFPIDTNPTIHVNQLADQVARVSGGYKNQP